MLPKVKELGYPVISDSSDGHCDLVVSNGENLIPHLLDSLKTNGVEVETVSLKKPTLDDVFLKYTGARIEEEKGESFAEARRTGERSGGSQNESGKCKEVFFERFDNHRT